MWMSSAVSSYHKMSKWSTLAWLSLTIELILITMPHRVKASSEVFTCPSMNHCMCIVTYEGLDILCDATISTYILEALESLKLNSTPIYWLRITLSRYHKIGDNHFTGLQIKNLLINKSYLKFVKKGAFSGLGELASLDLSYNDIYEIPSGELSKLKSATYLNLNYNKISSIQKSAFDGMTALDGLTLYGNKIKQIQSGAFDGIGRLTKLNLGNNDIDQVPVNLSRSLKNLQILNLKKNKIDSLPYEALIGMYRLKDLYLQENKIGRLFRRSFHDLLDVVSINISSNKITEIDSGTFGGKGPHLKYLHLGSNKLTHVPGDIASLFTLQQLDLNSNNIESIGESDFSGPGYTLRFLRLDGNGLKDIKPAAFHQIHSLQWIRLENNNLTSLGEFTMGHLLYSLKRIDISSNPLECNCDVYWYFNWLSETNQIEEGFDDPKCSKSYLEFKYNCVVRWDDYRFSLRAASPIFGSSMLLILSYSFVLLMKEIEQRTTFI